MTLLVDNFVSNKFKVEITWLLETKGDEVMKEMKGQA